ncbi:MAG: oligosaccharide flippase family protein [Thermoplasmataceae archaeon]
MFAQRSPVLIIQNVLSAILGFVGLFFILRYIGTTDWGFVAFGIGFVGIFSLIGDLGYSTAHTIKISAGEDIATCNATYLTIKVVLGLLFVVLVVAALEFWTLVLHRGFQSPIEYWIILALIPYFFFQNLTAFPNAYFRATLKSVRTSIPPLVEAIFRNSVFIFLALIVKYSGSGGYMDALYLSSTYSVSYSIYFVVGLVLGRPWKISRPTRTMFRAYTVIALPLMLVTSVGTISGNIDKVVIQLFWHADATGAFYTSQTIAAIITTLSGSMSTFFVPLLIKYQKFHGKSVHNQSIHEFERLISLYTLPLVIPLSVLSLYVMNIFTAGYIGFSLMLSLLSWRAYFSAINTPYSSSIVSRSKTMTIAKIDTSLVFLNIFLILILVPPKIFNISFFSLGAYGAAYAMLVVGIISAVMYRVVVIKMEGIKANYSIFRQVLPAGVQAGFLFWIQTIIVPKDILVLIPVTLASIIIYFIVAILMKETTLDEIRRVIYNFSPFAVKKRFEEEDTDTDEKIMGS